MSDDDAVLRMLAGANFGPDASLILPSGRQLAGDEAQALTSFYADDKCNRALAARVTDWCGLDVDHEGQCRPAPWRFDVPEVPDSVTAFKDGAGVVWIRGLVGPRRQRWAVWSDDPQAWQSAEWVDVRTALARLPLVECPDPRRTP